MSHYRLQILDAEIIQLKAFCLSKEPLVAEAALIRLKEVQAERQLTIEGDVYRAS